MLCMQAYTCAVGEFSHILFKICANKYSFGHTVHLSKH